MATSWRPSSPTGCPRAPGERIVVPATRPADDFALARVGSGVRHSVVSSDATPGVSAAERRLKDALHRFERPGLVLGGEVGDEDPFQATSDALARGEFDEVIVSTLPTGLPHWPRADLPSRIHRRFGVPVTTVTAKAG